MDPATTVSLIATASALAATAFTAWVGVRARRTEHRLVLERDRLLAEESIRQREHERRRDVVAPVLEPLLYAVSELQSRLHNLLVGALVEAFEDGSDRHRRSVIEYTCFVFAQYFGWIEALRRSVLLRETSTDDGKGRLSLGDVSDGGRLTVALISREISDALRSDEIGREFMLFSAEQHAIGALMFRWEDLGDRQVPSVMRFAEFSERFRHDADFRDWFVGIEDGLRDMRSEAADHRLRTVQSLTALFMTHLDPDHVVFRRRDPLLSPTDLDFMFTRYRF